MNELKRSLNSEEQIENIQKSGDTEQNKIEKDCGDPKNANFFQKIKIWFCKLTKKQKITLIVSLILSLIIGIVVAVLIFKIDSLIFPSSIDGYVLDNEKNPIEGAKVCVGDNCYNTERNGYYLLSNLTYGNVLLTAEADNFKQFSEEMYIKRGRIEKNIYLDPIGYGTLEGKLVVEDEEYDYSNLEVMLDSHEVKLGEDGSFSVQEVAIGEYELTIKSVDFKDIEKAVNVEVGENVLDDIELEKAADVTLAVIDWLSEEKLSGVNVKMGGDAKKTSQKGEVKFRDVSIEKKVSFTLSKNGYNEKNIKVKLNQGENKLENKEIVRSGKVAYVSNRLGNENVYISNYDGSDELMLSDNKGDSYSPYLTEDGQTVKFISTRDFVKGENDQVIPLAYSVSAQGGPITKISKTNYKENDIGRIGSFDFYSMKRAYVDSNYDQETQITTSSIYFGNLDGTNLKKLVDVEGYVNSVIIANSGNFVVYNYYNYQDTSQNGIYKLDVNSSAPQVVMKQEEDSYLPYVLDVSPDDTKILARKYDKTKRRWDLWTLSTGGTQEVQLTATSTSETMARFTPNGTQVSFMTTRDGKTDVYLIGSDGTGEVQVTGDGKVTDYFLNGEGFVLYNSEQSMWITQANDSVKHEKVTENVLGTYYSSHYSCYGTGGACGGMN